MERIIDKVDNEIRDIDKVLTLITETLSNSSGPFIKNKENEINSNLLLNYQEDYQEILTNLLKRE